MQNLKGSLMNNKNNNDIKIGISACLLGQKVRYDGSHKRSKYCLDVLGDYFSFTPFCPEVAIGLPTPREPIRLNDTDRGVRVQGVKDRSIDVTDQLRDYADQVSANHTDLCGYILMKNSPSCGMERVKVYDKNSFPEKKGRGAYAERLMMNNLALPVEEEARLNDPVLRENFITRVYVYHDWKTSVMAEPTLHKVIQFHSRRKYQLMAHNYQGYRRLGRYLAEEAPLAPLDEVLEIYIGMVMSVLTNRASRKSHTNVLMHILGYMKNSLDAETKQDLLEAIEQYRTQRVHLAVPMALIKHYLKRHGSSYIRAQAYLEPYPNDLGLRNYI